MSHSYKPKQGTKQRRLIDKDKLKKAVHDVIEKGKSLRGTAKEYSVAVMTLKRYVQKKKAADTTGAASPNYEPNYKQAQIFTNEEESIFTKHLEEASKLHHEWTPKETRELAYQFALKNNTKIPQTWLDNKIATKEWLCGFMCRNSALSVRIPEATNLAQTTSFNRNNILSLDKIKCEPSPPSPTASLISQSSSKSTTECSNISEVMVEIGKQKCLEDNQQKDNLDNDEDFLFLKSILPSMKKLNALQKLRFRGKINDWLIEELFLTDPLV